MKLSQPFPEARCYTFSRQYGALLEVNLGVVTVTLLSNEGDFNLHGYDNKQCPILGLRESTAYHYQSTTSRESFIITIFPCAE
jgi:hypothetical protein